MEKEPILPRPLAPTEELVRKWLGPEGVRRWQFEGNVGDRVTLAIEDAIREQHPDGNLPSVARLLDPSFLSPAEIEELRADGREVLAQSRAYFRQMSSMQLNAGASNEGPEAGANPPPSESTS